ncbi:MAG: xanthine dehydrogenase family protein molybdopterin-binding subunit [Betaproteobacteria bacterium]|nr:xanthine dehydrogenase family protein molybdopterin-binding subunit [Betaproteobacteria bacterium]
MANARLSRRDFLKTSGSLVVAFSFGPLLETAGRAAMADGAALKAVSLDQVDSFLSIGVDGTVTCYSGKVDLGTGVRTALTQIVADELTVALDKVRLIEGDTLLTPDQGPTYGSLAIQVGGMQIRQAAATARAALMSEAAKRWQVAPGELTTADGAVRTKSGARRISFGELVGGKEFSLSLDTGAPLLDPAQYRFVGRSISRLDIPGKVSGEFTYMQDFRVPGMLHARVVRPLAIGAQLASVDESSVSGIPGLVKVVRDGNFLAVVARTEWGAIRAAQQLKASWSDWSGLPDESRLWEHVRATRIVKNDITSNVGRTEQALPRAAKRLSATYDFAIHTHGSIGPSCAVAEFRDGKLTSWSASQATHNLRKQLASMLSLPEDQVRAIYVEGAGCYGRNGHEDAAADAALLARAVGQPVRVQWMRADEHGWDPKGPPTLIDLEAGLDTAGRVVAWHSQFYVPAGAAGTVPLVTAQLASLPHETGMSPGNIINDTALPYAFPNVLTVAHRLADTPLRPSWIRTPGRMQNTFANEAFLDELAIAAKTDPFEFRVRYLDDPRGIELLKRLQAFAKWQGRTSSKHSGGDTVTGRGVAYVKYELYRTYVGAVATVEVNRTTGAIRVKHFAVVQDCGQIINPDGVKNQIEGNVLQTVSRTLKEQVTFDRSRVTSVDWASYPILTFPEIPDVDIALIDRPTEKPWGAGEPSAAVVPAAISNAVCDAVGVRLRSVPFLPQKVLAALKSV